MVLTKADEALLYEADCAMFAEEKLGLDLHEQRIRHFLNTRADEVILLWSRQAGKTTGSAAKVTHRAVFSPGTLSLIVSATQRQCDKVHAPVEARWPVGEDGQKRCSL